MAFHQAQNHLHALTQYCATLAEENDLLSHNNTWSMRELSVRLHQCQDVGHHLECAESRCAELMCELECEKEAHAHTVATQLDARQRLEKDVADRDVMLERITKHQKALVAHNAKLESRIVLMEAARKESVAKLEASKKESVAKLEASKKESVAKLEAARKESVAKLEAARKESVAKLEAARKESGGVGKMKKKYEVLMNRAAAIMEEQSEARSRLDSKLLDLEAYNVDFEVCNSQLKDRITDLEQTNDTIGVLLAVALKERDDARTEFESRVMCLEEDVKRARSAKVKIDDVAKQLQVASAMLKK